MVAPWQVASSVATPRRQVEPRILAPSTTAQSATIGQLLAAPPVVFTPALCTIASFPATAGT